MKIDWLRSRRLRLLLAVPILASLGAIVARHATGPDALSSLNVASVAAAALGELKVSEPVVLLERPRLVLENGTFQVEPTRGGLFKATESPEAALAKGRADIVLSDARITLYSKSVSDSDGASEADAALNGSSILSALSRLGFEHLRVAKSTLVVKRAFQEETFEDLNAEIATTGGKALRGKATARIRDDVLNVDATLGAPQKTPYGAEQAVEAKVSGSFLEASFKGQLRTGELFTLTAPSAKLVVPDLRKAARWLGVEWPDGPGLGAFTAEGIVDWGSGRLAFDRADFKIDGNEAVGNLSLSLSEGRPFIEATLAFEHFEIAPYLSETVATEYTALLQAGMPFFSYLEDFASPYLAEVIDADVRMSATSVTYSDKPLGRGAATLNIKDRTMAAELAEVELATGGSGNIRINLDVTGSVPRTSVSGSLDGLELGSIATALFGHPFITGRGTVRADLEGPGYFGGHYAETASGLLAIETSEEGFLAGNPATLAAASGHMSQGELRTGWGSAAADPVRTSKLVAHFAAENGRFNVSKLTCSCGGNTVRGEGTVIPAQHALDLTLFVSNPRIVDVRGAPVVSAVSIEGSWREPHIRRADSADMSAEAGAAPSPTGALPESP